MLLFEYFGVRNEVAMRDMREFFLTLPGLGGMSYHTVVYLYFVFDMILYLISTVNKHTNTNTKSQPAQCVILTDSDFHTPIFIMFMNIDTPPYT